MEDLCLCLFSFSVPLLFKKIIPIKLAWRLYIKKSVDCRDNEMISEIYGSTSLLIIVPF